MKVIGNIDSLRLNDAVDLDLVVDGGNVVRCGNKIVMTEKVFFENKDKPRKEVQRLLEEDFLCDVAFLPWDRNEFMGHSDGIIHYLGDNRVMMTNYADFNADMALRFNKVLEKHFEVVHCHTIQRGNISIVGLISISCKLAEWFLSHNWAYQKMNKHCNRYQRQCRVAK